MGKTGACKRNSIQKLNNVLPFPRQQSPPLFLFLLFPILLLLPPTPNPLPPSPSYASTSRPPPSTRSSQGRVETYTPPTNWGGPGLRGARKGPGAYQSRAQCAWGKKRRKKKEKKERKRKKREEKEKRKKHCSSVQSVMEHH